MKKISVSVSYDEEKLSTLRLYLEQKGMQVEEELTKSLDTLYAKNVPTGVREFGKPEARISLTEGRGAASLLPCQRNLCAGSVVRI